MSTPIPTAGARQPARGRAPRRALAIPAMVAAMAGTPATGLAQAGDSSLGTTATASAPRRAEELPRVSGPTRRLHTFARPATRERAAWFYGTVLGAETRELAIPSAPSSPMLLVRFADGGSVSIEFRDDALDDAQALRGAWAELRSDRPDSLQRRIVEAGIARVPYGGADMFYFQAPGGQVFRIAPQAIRP